MCLNIPYYLHGNVQDIQSGVCGFGDTQAQAMIAFNDAFISR